MSPTPRKTIMLPQRSTLKTKLRKLQKQLEAEDAIQRAYPQHAVIEVAVTESLKSRGIK